MAFIFGYDSKLAGCFSRLNIDNAHSQGAYIEFKGSPLYPVPLPDQDSAIITDIAFAQKEKFYLVDCFQDTTYVYAFGRDAGSSLITVSTLCFLSSDGLSTFGGPLLNAFKVYSENRLSKNPTTVNIHCGDALLEGIVVGQRGSVTDLAHQLQTITYDFLALRTLGDQA